MWSRPISSCLTLPGCFLTRSESFLYPGSKLGQPLPNTHFLRTSSKCNPRRKRHIHRLDSFGLHMGLTHRYRYREKPKGKGVLSVQYEWLAGGLQPIHQSQISLRKLKGYHTKGLTKSICLGVKKEAEHVYTPLVLYVAIIYHMVCWHSLGTLNG